MKQLKSAKSGLFLLELIVVILFFSLGSTVCIQAFTKAHLMSQKAQDLSFASLKASETTSVIKYTDCTLESLQEYFPHAAEKNGEFLIFYNENYEECGEQDSRYVLHTALAPDGRAQTAHIRVLRCDAEKTIYELQIRFPAVSPQNSSISPQEADS